MQKHFEIGDSVYFLVGKEVAYAEIIDICANNSYYELDYAPGWCNPTRNSSELYSTEAEAYIALTKLLVQSLSELESKIDHLVSEVRDLNSATFTTQSSW